MSKYTPGPFSRTPLGLNTGTISILAPEKENGWSTVLASITAKNTPPEEAEANANLFAAAPEMLEALSLAQRMMQNLMAKGNINWGTTFGIDFGLMNETLIKLDRSIAKAEGRS